MLMKLGFSLHFTQVKKKKKWKNKISVPSEGDGETAFDIWTCDVISWEYISQLVLVLNGKQICILNVRRWDWTGGSAVSESAPTLLFSFISRFAFRPSSNLTALSHSIFTTTALFVSPPPFSLVCTAVASEWGT